MNLIERLVEAVNREYERRVRRASLITEYGAPHHTEDEDEDEGEVEIVNVPRGGQVNRSTP
ncbi:MAG TPA: hypothetical protein VFS21_25060 [Roseiflexaceae bacterium]|nr:hypothetical protein [Roseiflexaceae bacterium]